MQIRVLLQNAHWFIGSEPNIRRCSREKKLISLAYFLVLYKYTNLRLQISKFLTQPNERFYVRAATDGNNKINITKLINKYPTGSHEATAILKTDNVDMQLEKNQISIKSAVFNKRITPTLTVTLAEQKYSPFSSSIALSRRIWSGQSTKAYPRFNTTLLGPKSCSSNKLCSVSSVTRLSKLPTYALNIMLSAHSVVSLAVPITKIKTTHINSNKYDKKQRTKCHARKDLQAASEQRVVIPEAVTLHRG